MKASQPALQGGFSLIEMVAVISIIAVIAGFTVPAVNGYLRGQRLSTASAALAGALAEAQQLARTRNRTVEVRFYRCTDPETPGSVAAYRGYQILLSDSNGGLWPERGVTWLGADVIFAENAEFSTVLKDAPTVATEADVELPRVNHSYEYAGIRFLPTGETSLGKASEDRWCLTLVNETAYTDPDKLPPNFVTVQIDSYTGSLRTLQP